MVTPQDEPAGPPLSSRGHMGSPSSPRSPGMQDPGRSSRAVGCRWPSGDPGASVSSLSPLTVWVCPPEPSDPQGRECLRLLQQLHGCAQRLWEVTERSLRALRERLRHPDAIGLESLLLLLEADHVLQVHME